MSIEIKTKHNHNIEHEVTDCSFLTAKYLKCDCFTECLFTWIMYMIETISDINQFKEDGQDAWLKIGFGSLCQNVVLGMSYVLGVPS